MPIYEPLFADGSYGYCPNRSAKDAILKVKEYAEQGYTFAVVLDLSKYFDTLNHEILINLLRKNVKDERVVQLIKRYLKRAVYDTKVKAVAAEDMEELIAERQAVRDKETHRARAKLLAKYGEAFKDRFFDEAVEKVDCEIRGKVYVKREQTIES